MQAQFDKLLRKALADKYGLGPIVDDIEKMKPFMEKVNSMQDVIKGDEGKTPVRGEDYLTEEEMQQIRAEATPQKGVHYTDGQDGRDGYTPVRGVDYLDDEELADIKARSMPVKGKDYFTPQEVAEFKRSITPRKGVDYRDGSDGANPDPKEVLAFFKSLKGEDAKQFSKVIGGLIDISNVRNAESFIFNGKKYQTHELMHGSGSSGSNVVFVDDEVVGGSGKAFTLANVPVAASQAIYGNGQRLTPGVGNDYTISGAVLTMANSFSIGAILADYRVNGAAASVQFADNEIVNGSGTTFTLAATPLAGTVQLYGGGQRLTPGASNDYTITGANITTSNSYVAGAILADYHY